MRDDMEDVERMGDADDTTGRRRVEEAGQDVCVDTSLRDRTHGW